MTRCSSVPTVVVVGVVAVLCMCARSHAAPDAATLNTQALELAYADKLSDALVLFQQAVDAAPGAPEYLNNLGVTHMRLDNMAEAKRCFLQALEVDRGHPDALRNLEELQGEVASEPTKIEHTLLEMPRIPLSELFLPKNKAYHTFTRPFLLTGAMEHPKWKRAMHTWSAAHFAKLFPNVRADFYPHNMHQESVRPFLVPWSEVMAELRQPTKKYPRSPTHPGTYIQWNVGEEEWHWILENEIGPIPEFFTPDEEWLQGCLPTPKLRDEFTRETHWRMVLIGSQGAGMFNHQDTLRTSSFQAQVKGRKKWHVCGPDQTRFLYGAGKVDFFHPKYNLYPLARNATCYQYVIEPGEMMFYPRDWWHQTYNVDDENISITGTIADGLNFDSISHELQTDVNRPLPIIMSPSMELREAMEGCYDWLAEVYGGSLA